MTHGKPYDHVWVECPNGHGDTSHQHFDYCGCCETCGAVLVRCDSPSEATMPTILDIDTGTGS